MMLATMMAVTFVGCNKDEDAEKASITISPNPIVVDLNDLAALAELEVKVAVISSDEDLTSIAVYVQYALDGIQRYDVTNDFEAGKKIKTWEGKFTMVDFYGLQDVFETASDFTFYVEAKTENTVATEKATITIIPVNKPPEETDLTAAAEFTLGRPAQGGFPESAMGITWASNVDGNTAKFTTATNALAMINEATYNATTTQEALKAVFEAIPGKVSEFTAKSDANFTVQYLIVQDGATLRLVKMTALNFVAGANKAYFTEKH